MKKKVNGKVVDIDNIDIFEKAYEDMAINRVVINNISDIKADKFSIANMCIDLYSSFYIALPFPLYGLDTNIKYSTIGTYIKHKVNKNLPMWVDNGLFICIDEVNKMALNFVNYTWGLYKVNSIKEDNTNIDLYKTELGFIELSWALYQISNNRTTADFYKIFMKDFVNACNNQPLILKWELGNILEFGNIPDRIDLKNNKILDTDNNKEYTLDIFATGFRESTDTQHIISLVSDTIGIENKQICEYDFSIYEKNLDTDGKNNNKMKECNLNGIISLFNTICLIKDINDNGRFSDYRSFIHERYLVYEINNRIFVTNAYKYKESKEIARDVSIYSFGKGIVYMVRTKNLGKGIKKETIYSYSLKDESLRLCRIQFTN